jgi:hypothetical protein
VRNALYSAVILAGLLFAPVADGRALAGENPTPIQDAPCRWFVRLYPGAWGTDHKILINPRLVIERVSFGQGNYRLADGTDAYDYLQRRCGDD